MLYREIIAVCSEVHTKHINTLCGQNGEFFGVFADLRKATKLPHGPLHPRGKTLLLLDGFLLNMIIEYFSKICGEN